MSEFTAGLWAVVLFVISFVLGGVLGAELTESKFAAGELACEQVHETLVCWNPKEEVKE